LYVIQFLLYTTPVGVTALKKHYHNLLMTLPVDHTITVGRFCDFNMYKIRDEVFDQIVSSTNSQWSNKKILNLIISVTNNDYQLLGLSFLIERLATGDVLSDCHNMEEFRNG